MFLHFVAKGASIKIYSPAGFPRGHFHHIFCHDVNLKFQLHISYLIYHISYIYIVYFSMVHLFSLSTPWGHQRLATTGIPTFWLLCVRCSARKVQPFGSFGFFRFGVRNQLKQIVGCQNHVRDLALGFKHFAPSGPKIKHTPTIPVTYSSSESWYLVIWLWKITYHRCPPIIRPGWLEDPPFISMIQL